MSTGDIAVSAGEDQTVTGGVPVSVSGEAVGVSRVDFASEDFSLGNNGYYIINGADMVIAEDAAFYGLEDGIHMQTKEEEILLTRDEARNLNYADERLYYCVSDSAGSNIKVIDLAGMELEKSFRLPGWDIRHMYLVSNRWLLFSAGGRLFTLDLDTAEVSPYGDYEEVFSFIHLDGGILYAQGSLFDYNLYVDGRPIVQHVTDYFVEREALVYTKDYEEYRLPVETLTDADADAGLPGTASDQRLSQENCPAEAGLESITVEEFLEELQEVTPAAYEEQAVFSSARVDTEAGAEQEAVLDLGQFEWEYPDRNLYAGNTVLTDARVSPGQAEIAEKAHEIYDDTWKPLGKVRRWSASPSETDMVDPENMKDRSTGEAVDEVHGIFYTQAVNNGTFVLDPAGMSWEEYKKERENPDSKMYSESISGWAWKYDEQKGETKYGPKYGCDCSTFAAYCWGLSERTTTAKLPEIGVKINKAQGDFLNLQVGDIINKAKDHVVVIIGIKYRSNGDIGWIETIEQTTDWTTQTTYKSYGDFLREKKYTEYTLYRSPYVADNTRLTLPAESYSCYTSDTFRLTPDAAPGGKLTWKSSKPTVASVDQNGQVTAKKAGKATITVTLTSDAAAQRQAQCEVTVMARTLSIDKKKTIYIGYPDTLRVQAVPDDTVVWKSGNNAIATVENGIITGKKTGTVKVTAKANGLTRTCTVTVKACSVKLDRTALEVYRGETKTLIATPTPAAEQITFSSSDSRIATVDQSGHVTGIKKGSATVTVRLQNGKKATCKVTVKAPTLTMAGSFSVYQGETKSLSATPKPASQITWKSKNTSVAAVDKNGRITGIAPGKTKIEATAHGITKTCTVTVNKPTLILNDTTLTVYRGYTGQIKANPQPAGAAVRWSSSDTSIARVDGNGTVTGVKAGTAKITVMAHGITKICKVTVKNPSFSLKPDSMTVYRGSTGTLAATAKPATAIRWMSSDGSVATVDKNGRVTGRKAGKATITAVAHGIFCVCTVTVREPTLSLKTSSMTIYKGYTGALEAKAVPNTAITYISSDETVARVSQNGVVTGIREGKATITAVAHGIRKKCTVLVKPTTLTATFGSGTVRVGRISCIQAKTTPSARIAFRSQNPSIAQVDGQGRVKGMRPGNTYVIVSANGKTQYISVIVLP